MINFVLLIVILRIRDVLDLRVETKKLIDDSNLLPCKLRKFATNCVIIRHNNDDEKNISLSPSDSKLNTLINGGRDTNNHTVYVCRAKHNSRVIPGHMTHARKWCAIIDGDKIYHYDKFEMLLKPKSGHYQWKSVKKPVKKLPDNLIIGGRDSMREYYYIGRCSVFMSQRKRIAVQIGSVIWNNTLSEWLTHVAIDDNQIECFDYDVLIYRGVSR